MIKNVCGYYRYRKQIKNLLKNRVRAMTIVVSKSGKFNIKMDNEQNMLDAIVRKLNGR